LERFRHDDRRDASDEKYNYHLFHTVESNLNAAAAMYRNVKCTLPVIRPKYATVQAVRDPKSDSGSNALVVV
jgi:hypothetical protein